MHANQITAFCATRIAADSRAHFQKPWLNNGLIYATDGKMMLRFPAGLDEIWINPPEPGKATELALRAEQMFDEAPAGEVRSLSAFSFEPVIDRMVMDVWEETEHEHGNQEVWFARMTEVKIDGASFDARRLLFARQTLNAELSYHHVPNRTEYHALRLAWGDRGELLLMPARMGNAALHWDGKRYWPGNY